MKSGFAASDVVMRTDARAYPGSAASAAEFLALADAYRQAAMSLRECPRPRFWRAPATLCAIHAIELYLNAFMLHHGSTAAQLRADLHDLQVRGARAGELGLTLRGRTSEHLAKMTRDREYLVSRYGPEECAALSQVNRLVATMDEIAVKVASALAPAGGVSGGMPAVRRPPDVLPSHPACSELAP